MKMNKLSKISMAILFLIAAGNTFAADEIRFHPLESFQIKYVHEGMMSGESTQQCRNWCREMVNTMNQNMSMMGITRNTNQKTITIEDKIYNIDLDKGTATEANNPMYDSMVEASQNNGDDPMAFAQQWMDSLGYQATGNTRTILGETCNDYTSSQLAGSTVCMTEDGLTLRMEMNMAGMSSVQTAIEVKRNDPGDDADYEVPAGAKPVTLPEGMEDMPEIDMEQIKELLKNLKMGQ